MHRSDCLNATELSEGQPDRLIDVEWDDEHVGRFSTTIEILALDRAALLVDVAGPTRLVVEGVDLEGLARGWRLARVGGQVGWVKDADWSEPGTSA